MGAVAVGATIYFGSTESNRQIQEISEAFRYAHELGMATVLWAYLRDPAFKTEEKDPNQAVTLNIGEVETERTREGMTCEKAVTVRWLREIIVTGRTKAPKLAQSFHRWY